MQDPLVEIRSLRKVFRDFWGRPRVEALHDLDLDVGAGEILGLLGPNGSGKSTTIRLLLGLLHPTSGSIRILGGSPRDVRLKSRIGYEPEESFFHPHLTAEETLLFYARIFGLPAALARSRATDLLGLLGLSSARARPVGEFSKGMLRRIGLAQALINDPELVILDEPTAGMDPIGTREVKDLLRDLKRRGKTVILSSHLLADVEDVCDRICILHEGRRRALGPVRALLEEDQRTQIVTDRLSPGTIEAVLALLRDREGPGLRVDVGAPSSRLEDFFLRTVARRDSPSGPPEGTRP